MVSRTFVLFSLFAFVPLSSTAQTPTWADDVACIVYSHCVGCHRNGGIAPFPLLDYNDLYTIRYDARDALQARYMPPWPPDEEYRRLAHERVLTQDEIDIVTEWVNGGAPEGDPLDAPPPPTFVSNWEITQPDITVIMDDYLVPLISDDLYRCFVLPTNTTVDTYIHGLEVVPGNTDIVHHVLVFQDTSGQAAQLDANDIEPGYTSFGGIGVNGAKLLGLWVPGSKAFFTPPGLSMKLLAGADLVIQVHYPFGSSGQIDSTRVNLELGNATLRSLNIDPILDHIFTITNGPLIIPPDQVKTFHAEYTVPLNATITGIGPHAHLVCTSMWAFAVTPSNDTIPLIDIPIWDLHWQDIYQFQQPIKLEAGTTLHGYATYDNTINNPNNPNSPPDWVFLGEATSDEMMLFYFPWTIYLPGDENIIVDTADHALHHQNCTTSFPVGITAPSMSEIISIWPVPANDWLHVELSEGVGSLRLLDVNGRVVHRASLTASSNTIDVSSLAHGTYLCEVRSSDGALIHRSKVVLQ